MVKVLSTKVPDEVYEVFRKKAEESGLSIASLLRHIVYKYLDIEPPKTPEQELEEKVQLLMERVSRLEKILYSGHRIAVPVPAPTATAVQDISDEGEDLPSYLKGNPWLEVLSKRGRERV